MALSEADALDGVGSQERVIDIAIAELQEVRRIITEA